jgi:hypothetical protein
MDTAIITAASGLFGSLTGALASVFGTWMNQNGQIRAQLRLQEVAKREGLYFDFIAEASKRLADAISRQTEDPRVILNLYAAVERMRLMSSSDVIDAAEALLDHVTEAYTGPNITLEDLHQKRREGLHDPLKDFGEACRTELRALGRASGWLAQNAAVRKRGDRADVAGVKRA